MSITPRFLNFELKCKLFESKIDNIHFWHLIRYDIYLEVMRDLGYFQVAHPKHQGRNTLLERFKNIVRLLRDHFQYGSYRRLKPNGVLFFRNHEVVISNNRVRDRFYDSFFRNLSIHYSLLEIGMQTRDERFASEPDSACNSELYLIKYLKIIKNLGKNTREIAETAEQLTRQINNHLSCHLTYSYMFGLLKKAIVNYGIYHDYYQKLLCRLQPKLVVLVCHSWHEYFVVCKVCREMGIKTIELQHGVTGEMDVAYNFGDDSIRTDYLPQTIFTFGRYWNQKIHFYNNDVKLVEVGYPMLEEVAAHQDSPEDPRKILIVSQGTVGVQLYRMAKSLADLAAPHGYQVLLRFHPGEYPVYQSLYPELTRENNLVIIPNEQMNIFDCIMMCGHIVGAYSLTMFEAVRLNKFVYVMEGPGREYVDCLLEDGLAQRFENAENLWYLIQKNKDKENNLTPEDYDKYFKPNAAENIIKEINELLKQSQGY